MKDLPICKICKQISYQIPCIYCNPICFTIETIEKVTKDMRATGFDEFSTNAILERLKTEGQAPAGTTPQTDKRKE